MTDDIEETDVAPPAPDAAEPDDETPDPDEEQAEAEPKNDPAPEEDA